MYKYKRYAAAIAALALLICGCSAKSAFSGFGMSLDEFSEALKSELGENSFGLSEFEVDQKLKDNGGYKQVYVSTNGELSVYIYTKASGDGIRVLTKTVNLGEFLKISEAIINILESSKDATEIKIKLLLGNAESAKYSYQRGTSVPEDDNGMAVYTDTMLVFTAVPRI
ncbi:MAG: hypothetical protein FWG30_06090 [Eubacteriaceae bacterium]|nr:hypothetical protein [Eubacteriaceae bacterium]